MKLGKKNRWQICIALFVVVVVAVSAVWFIRSVADTGEQYNDRELRNLEASIHRAAAACYAVEGVYPPDLAYLEEHYGIQINKDRFTVFYEAIAENLMPDITVVEN